MKRLILVCGPAAIGKSTFSNKFFSEHPKERCVILAADEVRKDMYGSYKKFPPEFNMMIVYREMFRRVKELTDKYEDITILFDTTMLYDELRLFMRRHMPQFDEYHLVLLKLHDYSVCLQRNRMRDPDKWVPEHIIKNMCEHYDDPGKNCLAHFDHYEEVYVD
jgi:tRNA uridine 5-carbamoylmethylation protein Kti12